MTRCKFIKDKDKPFTYIVYNKNDTLLGWIYFYEVWKKWAWEQDKDIIMSDDCLQEVVDKMREL